MKVKWIPTNLMGTVSQVQQPHEMLGQIGTSFCWFDIDTYDAKDYAINQIMGLDKNWAFDPKRTWKKYFSCKGVAKAQQAKWQDCKAYLASNRNDLPDSSVSFAFPQAGFQTGADLGFIKTTWYCTFKGRAYN